MPELSITTLVGKDVRSYIKDLAKLRITVFREYPYLYDGSTAYEEKYLKVYENCPQSLMVIVQHEGRLVGASSGLPLTSAAEEFQAPFIQQGYDPKQIFYCGESMMLKPFRGRGIYPRFFQARENHARALGQFSTIAFCAVIRPPDHSLKPVGYRPLDGYWARLGYVKRPEMVCHFAWPDLGEAVESLKPMVFWVKPLKQQWIDD